MQRIYLRVKLVVVLQSHCDIIRCLTIFFMKQNLKLRVNHIGIIHNFSMNTSYFSYALGFASNEQFDAQVCARSSRVFIVIELFNIASNEQVPVLYTGSHLQRVKRCKRK